VQSIGGGTVRFQRLAWLDCPDRPEVVGACSTGGAIEVLVDGKVMETFEAKIGDLLLVADGAVIATGARLLERSPWSRHVRAELPQGTVAVARWSDPPEIRPDDVTGLVQPTFPKGAGDVRLDLVDRVGHVLSTLWIPRDGSPLVAEGAVVRRGEILAGVSLMHRDEAAIGGIHELRDVLNARVPRSFGHVAKIAPCDARVEEIDATFVHLHATSGERVRVRRRAGAPLAVREGDDVRTGDALDCGQRPHHVLLRLWGEERFMQHLLDELELETARRSLTVPRVYWVLVVRAMLAWRRVLEPGDTGLSRHQILSRRAFERAQRETIARGGGVAATAAPVLRGLAAIARNAA
jgi:hypothetical protein